MRLQHLHATLIFCLLWVAFYPVLDGGLVYDDCEVWGPLAGLRLTESWFWSPCTHLPLRSLGCSAVLVAIVVEP